MFQLCDVCVRTSVFETNLHHVPLSIFVCRHRDEMKNWETAVLSAQGESEQRLDELERTREQVARLRGSLADVSDRLARGIEENESLYRRVRELEGRSSVPAVNGSIRDSRARSLDSLSDLTNIDFDLDTENVDKERFVVFFFYFFCFFYFLPPISLATI